MRKRLIFLSLLVIPLVFATGFQDFDFVDQDTYTFIDFTSLPGTGISGTGWMYFMYEDVLYAAASRRDFSGSEMFYKYNGTAWINAPEFYNGLTFLYSDLLYIGTVDDDLLMTSSNSNSPETYRWNGTQWNMISSPSSFISDQYFVVEGYGVVLLDLDLDAFGYKVFFYPYSSGTIGSLDAKFIASPNYNGGILQTEDGFVYIVNKNQYIVYNGTFTSHSSDYIGLDKNGIVSNFIYLNETVTVLHVSTGDNPLELYASGGASDPCAYTSGDYVLTNQQCTVSNLDVVGDIILYNSTVTITGNVTKENIYIFNSTINVNGGNIA